MSKLSQYLIKNKITQVEFAAAVGTTQAHISRLAKGSMQPGLNLAVKIQNETGGFVRADSWSENSEGVSR